MTTIYETLYAPGQRLQETRFLPLQLPDNSHAPWREVRILTDFYRRGDHRLADKTGIFSPKFGLKTGVSGAEFIEFAESQTEADVCIINAFPELAYCSFNVWMQGECAHKGLTERAQALLDVCGIPWDLKAIPRHSSEHLCYCNFWVGTPQFWDAYMGTVVNPIATYLENHPDSAVTAALMEPTSHTDPAPFLPFIVERLLSTFLSLHPEFKVAVYPAPLDAATAQGTTRFAREMLAYLQPLVDAADAARQFPPWLIDLQDVMCRLSHEFGLLHFSVHPHPHTGRVQKLSD